MNSSPLFELDASHLDQDPYARHRTTPEGWTLSEALTARRNERAHPAEPVTGPAQEADAEAQAAEQPHPTHEAFLEPRTMPKRWDLSEYV